MKSIFLISLLLLTGCGSAVNCIEPEQAITVTYDDVNGVHKETVVVGSDFGLVAENQGVYSCMGQCGGGCTTDGPWLASCMSHDVCSFRNKSSGFLLDGNCGDEAASAVLSVTAYRLQGCQQE